MNAVDLDRSAAIGTAAIVDATSPDQYSAATPCADWTVRDLLTHLIAGNVKYIEIGRGMGWARGAPDVLLDDDPGAMYRRTMDAMLEAWEQPGALDRETALPVGRGRAELALYLHLAKRSCTAGISRKQRDSRLVGTPRLSRRVSPSSAVGFRRNDRQGHPSLMPQP